MTVISGQNTFHQHITDVKYIHIDRYRYTEAKTSTPSNEKKRVKTKRNLKAINKSISFQKH